MAVPREQVDGDNGLITEGGLRVQLSEDGQRAIVHLSVPELLAMVAHTAKARVDNAAQWRKSGQPKQASRLDASAEDNWELSRRIVRRSRRLMAEKGVA
jgi:hypothetical protein